MPQSLQFLLPSNKNSFADKIRQAGEESASCPLSWAAEHIFGFPPTMCTVLASPTSEGDEVEALAGSLIAQKPGPCRVRANLPPVFFTHLYDIV